MTVQHPITSQVLDLGQNDQHTVVEALARCHPHRDADTRPQSRHCLELMLYATSSEVASTTLLNLEGDCSSPMWTTLEVEENPEIAQKLILPLWPC